MRTWIMIDATYLCHRAFHSTGSLSYEGDQTGVIYGFLRDVRNLQRRFGTHRMVFCWDHGIGLREQRFKYYKESRRKKTGEPEYEHKQEIIRPQIEKLKSEYVLRMGYRNNFMQSGYEADDIIAKVIHDTIGKMKTGKRDDEFIIVTGDQDMYQLIQEDDVVVYHPREDKIINGKSFQSEFGIRPEQWALVKVVAGCSTDDVPGVAGVGNKTACKYWSGELAKSKTPNAKKLLKEIRKFMESKQSVHNYQLVSLPYKNLAQPLKEFDLWDDDLDHKEYKKILRDCGIKTLE